MDVDVGYLLTNPEFLFGQITKHIHRGDIDRAKFYMDRLNDYRKRKHGHPVAVRDRRHQ